MFSSFIKGHFIYLFICLFVLRWHVSHEVNSPDGEQWDHEVAWWLRFTVVERDRLQLPQIHWPKINYNSHGSTGQRSTTTPTDPLTKDWLQLTKFLWTKIDYNSHESSGQRLTTTPTDPLAKDRLQLPQIHWPKNCSYRRIRGGRCHGNIKHQTSILITWLTIGLYPSLSEILQKIIKAKQLTAFLHKKTIQEDFQSGFRAKHTHTHTHTNTQTHTHTHIHTVYS